MVYICLSIYLSIIYPSFFSTLSINLSKVKVECFFLKHGRFQPVDFVVFIYHSFLSKYPSIYLFSSLSREEEKARSDRQTIRKYSLFIHLSILSSTCLSVYLSIHPSMGEKARSDTQRWSKYNQLFIYLSIYLSIHLFIHPSIHL